MHTLSYHQLLASAAAVDERSLLLSVCVCLCLCTSDSRPPPLLLLPLLSPILAVTAGCLHWCLTSLRVCVCFLWGLWCHTGSVSPSANKEPLLDLLTYQSVWCGSAASVSSGRRRISLWIYSRSCTTWSLKRAAECDTCPAVIYTQDNETRCPRDDMLYQ